MIIADENIAINIIRGLRDSLIEVYSVMEEQRGISDTEIASLSLNLPGIILTEDKDFGEIAFSQQLQIAGCILLRYFLPQEDAVVKILIDFLADKSIEDLKGKFITITPEKIRIRTI